MAKICFMTGQAISSSWSIRNASSISAAKVSDRCWVPCPKLCSRYWTFFSVLKVSFSIFQRLRAARASSLALCGLSGRSVTQVNARRASSPGATPLRALQHLDLQVGVRSIQFHLRHHAQLAIPLLPFGRGIRKPGRIGTIQLSLQMRMVARPPEPPAESAVHAPAAAGSGDPARTAHRQSRSASCADRAKPGPELAGPRHPARSRSSSSHPRCEPLLSPSAAPAADPDAPSPHTTADGSTWSNRCGAGPADSTDREPAGRKRCRYHPRLPDNDRATPTSAAAPCRAGRVAEPAETPADTAPARSDPGTAQGRVAGNLRQTVQTMQIHLHHRVPVPR